jgi:hypothetical protein
VVDIKVSLRVVADLFFVKAIKNFNNFIYLHNYVLINDVVTDFVYIMWCRNPIGEGANGRRSYVSEVDVVEFVDRKFLS